MELASVLLACSLTISASITRSIVEVESGGQPFTIQDNETGESHRYASEPEVISAAEYLIQKGHSVDLGLGQINSRNLDYLGLSVRDIFSPCVNLYALQTIFLDGYQRSSGTPRDRLISALSFYNTGHKSKGIANGYVARVIAAMSDPKSINIELGESTASENTSAVPSITISAKPTNNKATDTGRRLSAFRGDRMKGKNNSNE